MTTAIKEHNVLSPLITIVLCVIGIALAGTWSNLVGYSPAITPPQPSGNTFQMSVSFSAGRLVIALLFIIFASTLSRHMGHLALAIGAFMSPIALILALAADQSLETVNSLDLGLIADGVSFIGSAGFLLLSAPLFTILAHCAGPKKAAIATGNAIIIECLFSSIASLAIPRVGQVLICTLAPLLASICLLTCEVRGAQRFPSIQDLERLEPKPLSSIAKESFRDKLGITLLLIEFSLAMALSAFLRSISPMGPWGYTHRGYLGPDVTDWTIPLLTILVIAIATTVIFVIPRKLPAQAQYAIALVLVLTGLQVAALGPTQGPSSFATIALVMGCQLYARVLLWIIYMECVRTIAIEPLCMNGLGWLFNIAAVALSWLTASGANSAALATIFLYLLVIVAIAAAVLPFVALPSERSESNRTLPDKTDAKPSPVPYESPSDEDSEIENPNQHPSPIHCFGMAYGISPREEQVLTLLIENRTRGEIERLLGLSEGTVRTHTSSIYRKLNVHSKQDARTLFANFNDGN